MLAPVLSCGSLQGHRKPSGLTAGAVSVTPQLSPAKQAPSPGSQDLGCPRKGPCGSRQVSPPSQLV